MLASVRRPKERRCRQSTPVSTCWSPGPFSPIRNLAGIYWMPTTRALARASTGRGGVVYGALVLLSVLPRRGGGVCVDSCPTVRTAEDIAGCTRYPWKLSHHCHSDVNPYCGLTPFLCGTIDLACRSVGSPENGAEGRGPKTRRPIAI